MPRLITDAGIKLIQSFESCTLTRYQDEGGIWTQGWGHIKGITADSQPITQNQADAWFLEDISIAEASVSCLITERLTDDQYDAVVSLAYNAGSAPLLGRLGRYLNSGDMNKAAAEFDKWVHVKENGIEVVCNGLVRRRAAEKQLFLMPT
jgi:lysozyme